MTDQSEGPAVGMMRNARVRHGLTALATAVAAWMVSSNQDASPFVIFGVVLVVGFVIAQFIERAVTRDDPSQG
ncbi:MAG: hypothetical protein AAF541_09550 [Pseudomonadota bacterium]